MRRLSDEQGTVAIIVALSLTTLMGMAALAIDVGAMLTEQRAVQNGADAAAIAIAKLCAEHAVDPIANPTPCAGAQAAATADTYFASNSTSPVTSTEPTLAISYEGRVGQVTVMGAVDQQPMFARVLGTDGPLTVTASSTARWGPLTAVDAVFPLVICKGALPDPGVVVTLMVDPTSPDPPDECDGAPEEPPFGWITPDDPDACTSKITLLPPTYLDIDDAANEPTNSGCVLELDELHNDIDATAVCHTTPNETYHCHGSADADDRIRILAVYDPTAGSTNARPSYSLVAFEFTGARLGDRLSYSSGGWSEPCAESDPAAIDDMQCIEGIVHDYIPPTDGPIVDPTVAALLPGIEDTSVLDVRLVD